MLYMKQKFSPRKYQKESGDDWCNSKFVCTISSIQTQIYQVKNMIQQCIIIAICFYFLAGNISDFSPICNRYVCSPLGDRRYTISMIFTCWYSFCRILNSYHRTCETKLLIKILFIADNFIIFN